jgi:hypothetical protein
MKDLDVSEFYLEVEGLRHQAQHLLSHVNQQQLLICTSCNRTTLAI